MSNPYTKPTITGYNPNPPPNDASTGTDNVVNWSGGQTGTNIKTDLADPIKVYADSINNEVFDAFADLITRPSLDFGDYDTITGNTSPATSKFNYQSGLSTITDSAVITLPLASTVSEGKRRRFRNKSTANVYLQRTSSDTIDGATTYRIPSYSIVEVTSNNVSEWMVTIRPAHRVGDFIESGKAAAEPGEIAADGSAVSRTTYAGLFAVIGETFGSGDGSTTFNVPDRRSRGSIGAGTGSLKEVVGAANVNTTNDTFDVASNTATWITGMEVTVTSDGTLPTTNPAGGFASPVFVVRTSATTVKFATTRANAVAGTVIDITTQGTGNHTITHTLTARTLGQKLGEESHANTVAETPIHGHAVVDPGHTHTEQAADPDPGGIGPRIIYSYRSNVFTPPTYVTYINTNSSTTGISLSNTGSSDSANNMSPELVVNVFIKT